MWLFGRLHKLKDPRDELISTLLAALNQSLDHEEYLLQHNQALREHLKEIHQDWSACIDPDKEKK